MSELRPLIVVSDEHLLDEVLRLAAAADCQIECAPDLHKARTGWSRAPLVIVDEEALSGCAPEALPRRSAVMLVCSGEPAPPTWQRAFSAGFEHVIALPADEASLISVLADIAEQPTRCEGRVLAVIGGRGGGGASVLAAGVGVTASRAGKGALLVDCDALGGGADLIFGAEHESGVRWLDLSLNSGRVSMSALWDALPDCSYGQGRLAVLSCGRDGGSPDVNGIAAVIDAGRRAGCTVLCDLPRDIDDTGWQVIDRADLVAIVVPAEVRASAAAKVVADRLADRARKIAVVVRGPAPDGLSAEMVADAVGHPLLAAIRADPKLAQALERGEFQPRPSGPLAVGSREVLDALWNAEVQVGAA